MSGSRCAILGSRSVRRTCNHRRRRTIAETDAGGQENDGLLAAVPTGLDGPFLVCLPGQRNQARNQGLGTRYVHGFPAPTGGTRLVRGFLGFFGGFCFGGGPDVGVSAGDDGFGTGRRMDPNRSPQTGSSSPSGGDLGGGEGLGMGANPWWMRTIASLGGKGSPCSETARGPGQPARPSSSRSPVPIVRQCPKGRAPAPPAIGPVSQSTPWLPCGRSVSPIVCRWR